MSDVGSEMSDVNPDVLKKRTFELGLRCVRLSESLTKSKAGDVIGRQLIRSATSVAANYRASRRARSRPEFIAKLGIALEECDETLLWLEYVCTLDLIKPRRVKTLRQEAEELVAILVATIKSAKSRNPSKSQ